MSCRLLLSNEVNTSDKTATVNCGETVPCTSCVRKESGTKIAVAYLSVDCDSKYAPSVDEMARTGFVLLAKSHSNTLVTTSVVETIGVAVTYLGHGPSLENVNPVE